MSSSGREGEPTMSARISPAEASGRAGRAAQHGAWSAAQHANGEAGMLPTDWDDLGTSDHMVLVYEADAYLVDAVSRFVGTGLAAGEAAIVIATPLHREQLDARLRADGVDLATACAQGQYVALDAAETLAQLMIDGWPDAQRFAEVVGDIIVRTCAPLGRWWHSCGRQGTAPPRSGSRRSGTISPRPTPSHCCVLIPYVALLRKHTPSSSSPSARRTPTSSRRRATRR